MPRMLLPWPLAYPPDTPRLPCASKTDEMAYLHGWRKVKGWEREWHGLTTKRHGYKAVDLVRRWSVHAREARAAEEHSWSQCATCLQCPAARAILEISGEWTGNRFMQHL